MALAQYANETLTGIVYENQVDNLCPLEIRNLHTLSKNYCNSLMATNTTGIVAENCTLAYAQLYLCKLNECYRKINNVNTFDGWMSTYTLLGILRAPTHFRNFAWI